MRIAIDASTWGNRRGFGRFTREIVAALVRLDTPHRFVLFTDGAAATGLDVETVAVRQSRAVAEAAVADGSRHPFDLLRFSAAVASARADVLFYPAVYSWFPCPPGLPNLLTLHDAIAEHYPGMVFPQWRFRKLWQLKVRLARLQATRFLTVSKAARAEIEAYMGIAREQVDLTTEAPKAVFRPPASKEALAAAAARLRERLGLPAQARWFSYVGGFAPHKNLLGLVDAFASVAAGIGRDLRDLHLLLVGDIAGSGFHSNVEQIRARLGNVPSLSGRVHFTGYVDDETLAEIYASSLAAVLPSFSEGFGLPLVEAMACGTPVLAGQAGSMPEIVADAGLTFDPSDGHAMAACMQALVDEPALVRDLSARSLRRAADFSWHEAARLALASIERCAGGRRR